MTQSQSPRTSDAGISALFDLSFTRFITIGIIKFVYILAVLGVAVSWLVMVIAGFNVNAVAGFLAIIVASIVSVLNLLIVRMGLELVVVIFRIGQHTERLANGPAPVGGFPVEPIR